MLDQISSIIMSRTTINIDTPILKDLKRRQKIERKSLGRLVSDLLAESLARYDAKKPARPAFRWTSKPMGARVDLRDKEAVHAAMQDARNLYSGGRPRR